MGESTRKRRIITVLGVLVALLGLVALIVLWLWPKEVKQATGEVSTQVVKVITGKVPKVQLGGDGGQAEVDACPGDWVRMINYRLDAPVYAAHNGCAELVGRGDVILPLKPGDLVDVVDQRGRERSYEVVEMRDTPQHGQSTATIEDMDGELILQTCYWDDLTMKFVGLDPVPEATT